MAIPADLPRRRPTSNRRRITLLVAAGLIVVLFTLSRSIAGFYTDYLWFHDLDLTKVFTGILGARLQLFAVLGTVMFVATWASLAVADRLAPPVRRGAQEDEIVQRYRDAVQGNAAKVRTAVALVFALLTASGVQGHWQDLILFRNATPFGTKDPQFHKDISFYTFKLPFYEFLVSWALVAIIVITAVTLIVHYLNGGIRLQSPTARGASPQVKAHVSVLLAVIALLKAAGYYLERFQLVGSTRGFAQGAFYTDVKAKLPTLTLLMLISVFAGALLLYNIRRRGWALPAIAAGLWLFTSVVVGAIYPALIQQFKVKPAENRLERPYIQRNIEATRAAFGLTGVEETNFNYTAAPGALTAGDLQGASSTIRNVRLWDPNPIITTATFAKLQNLKDYYEVKDVDIDRYLVDGELTQTLIGVRELRSEGIPQDNWVNRHLAYTHGYGAVVAPANAATPEGQPAFSLSDLPPQGMPSLSEQGARVYIGEAAGAGDYVVVGTRQPEIDFQDPATRETKTSSYTGSKGIALNSTTRRLAYALRFGDTNILISNAITANSKVLYVRNVRERVQKGAPFLSFDADPYPVVLDGRILWVVDGYTTSNSYPYSQQPDTSGLTGSDLQKGFNYVRNSVKAVVDAYDGTVTYYSVDQPGKVDPVLASYRKAFPGLVKDRSTLPVGLESHFRYPEDLFKIQSQQFGRYHITTPDDFFQANDAWTVAKDPGVRTGAAQVAAPALGTPGPVSGNAVSQSFTAKDNRIPAVYQLQRLPGETADSFSVLLPFVPSSKGDDRQQLTAFLTANSDPGSYGKLRLFRMPSGQQINGPALVDASIQQNGDIAKELTLLNQSGSRVLFGNILLVPIKDSILYVRPLYVEAEDTNNRVPTLERVIVVYGGNAKIANTLQEALTSLFGAAPPTREQNTGGTQPTIPGSTTTPTPGGAIDAATADLIAKANVAFTAADTALRAGDLGEYKKQIDVARDLVARVAQSTGGGGATTTTTLPGSTPSTGPPPSASTTTVAPAATGPTSTVATA